MSSLKEELMPVFEAIRIESPEVFRFAGTPVNANAWENQDAYRQTPWASPTLPLVAALEQQLYASCYTQRFPGKPWPMPGAAARDSLVETLRGANCTRERWEGDWRVIAVERSGGVIAARQNLRRTLFPGDFAAPGHTAAPPRPGATIRVRFSRDSVEQQPGFYIAFSESAGEYPDHIGTLRFYFHLTSEAAPAWVNEITRRFNRFQIPFRLKCPDRAALYLRTDAGVLYSHKRYYAAAAVLVREAYEKLSPQLLDDTPLFAKRLGPGLALAEDPGGAHSFGTSRCRLVAEAIWTAYLAGSQTPEARWRATESQFAHYGLNVELPYLNPKSVDRYDFSWN